jgi:hypothetical protein
LEYPKKNIINLMVIEAG